MKMETRERKAIEKMKKFDGFKPQNGKYKMIDVSVRCSTCGTENEMLVNRNRYLKWINKEMLAQDAMPELTASQREMLISKTCSDCYSKLVKGLQ